MKRKDLVIDTGLICAFGGLIFFVQAGMMDKLDAFIYHLIAPLINSRLTSILKIVTAFGDTLFMIIITIILFWLLKPKGRGKDIAILMIVTTIINNIIKVLVRRPRPTILPLVIEKSYSFPSGHTMAAVTLASFLIYVIWQEWGL